MVLRGRRPSAAHPPGPPEHKPQGGGRKAAQPLLLRLSVSRPGPLCGQSTKPWLPWKRPRPPPTGSSRLNPLPTSVPHQQVPSFHTSVEPWAGA